MDTEEFQDEDPYHYWQGGTHEYLHGKRHSYYEAERIRRNSRVTWNPYQTAKERASRKMSNTEKYEYEDMEMCSKSDYLPMAPDKRPLPYIPDGVPRKEHIYDTIDDAAKGCC